MVGATDDTGRMMSMCGLLKDAALAGVAKE
jgi:hypothetical protein